MDPEQQAKAHNFLSYQNHTGFELQHIPMKNPPDNLHLLIHEKKIHANVASNWRRIFKVICCLILITLIDFALPVHFYMLLNW